MAELFEIRDVDRRTYEGALRDFLPDRLVDVHTHVWKAEHQRIGPDAFARVVSWPSRVARDNSVEDLVEGYRLMFPGKSVTPLMFASVYDADSMPAMNRYVSECAARTKFPALIYAHPTWTGAALERGIKGGRFLGAKVYLNLSPAYIPEKEIRIFDFLPPHQLDVLNRHGWVVMLHIPRDGRLRDPVNLAQMLEIETNWPKVRVIIAHMGRAYCDEDMGDAFTVLSATRNMVFDFSANTNDHVFEKALRTFGPERCLFGSDMPITRMRMRRHCEGGRYINVVPRGLYGDVSGDSHMGEADPPESDTITFFMYEEILAIKRAMERIGLGRSDVEAFFLGNAKRVLRI
ncbi:MAG TPA: amidohydrolase family protein [Spirochaetia bacterium]|nr:amidohydrolase family protein [Spirochaetia bacterium]